MGGRTTADAAEDGRDGDGDDDVEKGAIDVVRGRGGSGGSTRPTIVVRRAAAAAAAAARWREGSMVSGGVRSRSLLACCEIQLSG